jgi:putative ABC transport system permease protein
MIAHYVATAFRHFRQHKAATAINALGLALGFSCIIFAYGVASYFDQHDRHYPESDRTYFISQRLYSTRIGTSTPLLSRIPPLVADLMKADFPEFKVARATGQRNLAVVVGGAEHDIDVAFADPEFLGIFPLRFTFRNSEQPLQEPHSALITESLALRLFGTTQALGRTIGMRGREPVVVRGVFRSPAQPSHFGDAPTATLRFEALLSMDTLAARRRTEQMNTSESALGGWGDGNFFTYVLFPRAAAPAPRAFAEELKSFAKRHVPVDVPEREFHARHISELRLTSVEAGLGIEQFGVRGPSLLLLLAGAVLFISCLNYANLATALGIAKAREIGLRRAIGAGRGALAIQYLTEAQLLAAMAFAIGVGVVALAAPLLAGDSTWSVDLRLPLYGSLKFWAGLAAILFGVGLAAGAYPAFALSRSAPMTAMRQSRPGGAGRWPTWVLAAQFAVASFLIVSVMAIRSQNQELERAALQTASAPVVVLRNNLRAARVDFEVLRNELLQHRGIEAVTGMQFAPWSGTYALTGASPSADGVAPPVLVVINRVSHDYFSSLDFEQLAGRVFDRAHAADTWPASDYDASPRHVVIDRSLAAKLGWAQPEQSIGKYIHSGASRDGSKPAQQWLIIGVVEDKPLLTTSSGATSTVYMLSPSQALTPLIRLSRTDTAAALAHIDSVWRKLAPNVKPARRFIDEQFEVAFGEFRTAGNVLTGLAALAFAIAIAGLAGVAIHVIGRRTHEIGVRKTLGASVRQILTMLLTELSRPIVIASVIAWPLAFMAIQQYVKMFVLQTQLSPWPFLIGLLVTLGVAWLAVVVQAGRAAQLRPADVLRYE